MPAAVIFDLDGVLVDSEQVWDEARRKIVDETGGRWSETATRDMMGMSSIEWSSYVHDRLGVPLEPDEISERVVEQVLATYARSLPLLPHARETVERLSEHWRLGLASSSNRPVIETFLDHSGLRSRFAITVSSEEVEHGKPAPDVYLEAARRLRVAPTDCVAIEDSTNGIRAAVAAGMRTIAVPNARFAPGDDALASAAAVVPTLAELGAELVAHVLD